LVDFICRFASLLQKMKRLETRNTKLQHNVH
jgi:hypothetical protein